MNYTVLYICTLYTLGLADFSSEKKKKYHKHYSKSNWKLKLYYTLKFNQLELNKYFTIKNEFIQLFQSITQKKFSDLVLSMIKWVIFFIDEMREIKNEI